jgi:hypothetical protein
MFLIADIHKDRRPGLMEQEDKDALTSLQTGMYKYKVW